jgi:hypothetical protein
MHAKSGFQSAIACGLIACAALGAGGALAADAPAGERWRQTQSMEMMGMSMPGRTMEFCQEAGNNDLPVRPDKDCRMHDVKRTPNGATFKMSCTGEHAAEAEGETTFLGPNHTRTKMHMKMAEGEMTMNMESEKLAGGCTGNETNLVAKREAAKAQAMGEQALAKARAEQAKACAEAARTADSPALLANCKDPATVKTYCSNFQTYGPFRRQAEEEARHGRSGAAVSGAVAAQVQPLSTSAKLCGVDANKVRERLCGTAEAQGQMAFIATQCIGLARTIAARECAGRSYTSVSAQYYPICSSLAGPAAEDADAGAGAAPAQASKVCVEAARTADSPDSMTKECKDPATLATYCASFQSLDAFRKQAEKEARLIKAGTPANERTRPLATSLNLCKLELDGVLRQLCAKAREQGDTAFVSSQCAKVAAEEKKPGALSKGKKILGGLLGN